MTLLLLISAGVLAGLTGALLGVGGGVILVPTLVLGFKVPLEDAVPASLMCVVASSCGAAASYVERRLSDIRLGLTLELATVMGAIVGGHIAAVVLAHRLALRAQGARPILAGLPLVLVMIGYTILSLWIIAQPIVVEPT